ncbi:MAG TPA: DNA polymerase I [Treponemataceae bacterium]|nr:DNA polymerase I [Treponemataceae bacterium]
MKKPIYVLDAYGLIYRAYFAFISKPLVNQNGNNVSAIFGFFRNLNALINQYSPEYFIAAFDSRTPTFRHEMYNEYKANRAKTPEDLHAQVPLIEEILTALGIPLVRQDGFEADDIIASIATRCQAEKRPCVIISGDKDLVQLVNEYVSVLKPGKMGGWEAVDSEAVKEEWGIGPELMLDFLSLTGDASDNIPGVKGVGEKTALKLLGEYGTLDGIYEHAEDIKGAIGVKIRENKDMAYFSKKLIALCNEVPLDQDLNSYACTSLDRVAASRLMMREGLPALAKTWSGETTEETKNENQNPSISNLTYLKLPNEWTPPLSNELPQTSLTQNTGTYHTLVDPQELKNLVDKALSQKIAAFDTETTGLDIQKDKIVGFSISLKSREAYYIPLRGPTPELGEEASPVMEEKLAFEQIERLFTTQDFTLIMHNGKFDGQILQKNGAFSSINSTIFDTMIAAWLLDPDWTSFGLDSLASSLLGLSTILYKDLVPKGKNFSDIPISEATTYAAEDADLTFQLYEKLSPKLKEQNLESLFFNLEMPLLPILLNMELAGIKIEKAELAVFSLELEKDIQETEHKIFETVGHEFNVASPKQLQEVLFTERKLTPGKKTKTGYSTDTSVLENLASEDILPGMILDYRGLAKLKSTYVDALPSLADAQGRIHTSFIQTGTATGRLSSRDPNLQNIPIKDDNGRRIRSAFRAEDGNVLVSADYAQIELVILAHLSNDTNLVDAFMSGVDVHRRTASLIYGVETEEVTSDMRRVAKTINFGVMYGMSAFRLANELRIPRGQAAGFINTYFQTYSGVASFIEETKEKAKQTGYVETIMGRRRYIRAIHSSNKIELSGAERIAVNTPIQGSAADIVKAAMLKVDSALKQNNLQTRLLLQVHDELILEAPESEAKIVTNIVKKEMEGVITLAVPLKVSVETGLRWGDFH